MKHQINSNLIYIKSIRRRKTNMKKRKKNAIKKSSKMQKSIIMGLMTNQVFKKYYDRTYYEYVDLDKDPKEFSIFTYY